MSPVFPPKAQGAALSASRPHGEAHAPFPQVGMRPESCLDGNFQEQLVPASLPEEGENGLPTRLAGRGLV